jgi:hypothetical protein
VLASRPIITQDGLYRGIWYLDFERSEFVSCGHGDFARWWFNAESEGPYTAYQGATGISDLESAASLPPVYVEVDANLSPAGNYGHFGMFERELVVSEVVTISLDIPEFCTDVETEP